MEKIFINNIEIEISKKKIKNLYLSIKAADGRVCISAPLAMSKERIEIFARSKSAWIEKKLEGIRRLPTKSECLYISGDTILFWGRAYDLEVVYAHRNKVEIEGNRIKLHARKTSSARNRENIINNWYRIRMRSEIDSLIELCQKTVGVSAAEWGIKIMKTRWGTCSLGKKKIWLNLHLAKKSLDCLEYVIIHELTHLLERNHSKRFYSYMDRFLPNWRETRKLLNNLV